MILNDFTPKNLIPQLKHAHYNIPKDTNKRSIPKMLIALGSAASK